jgi:hypothetical protein
VFERVFTPEGRADYDRLSADEQAEVDHILEDLERQPRSDERTRMTFDMPDWTAGVYILDNRFIEIIGIRRIAG